MCSLNRCDTEYCPRAPAAHQRPDGAVAGRRHEGDERRQRRAHAPAGLPVLRVVAADAEAHLWRQARRPVNHAAVRMECQLLSDRVHGGVPRVNDAATKVGSQFDLCTRTCTRRVRTSRSFQRGLLSRPSRHILFPDLSGAAVDNNMRVHKRLVHGASRPAQQ